MTTSKAMSLSALFSYSLKISRAAYSSPQLVLWSTQYTISCLDKNIASGSPAPWEDYASLPALPPVRKGLLKTSRVTHVSSFNRSPVNSRAASSNLVALSKDLASGSPAPGFLPSVVKQPLESEIPASKATSPSSLFCSNVKSRAFFSSKSVALHAEDATPKHLVSTLDKNLGSGGISGRPADVQEPDESRWEIDRDWYAPADVQGPDESGWEIHHDWYELSILRVISEER